MNREEKHSVTLMQFIFLIHGVQLATGVLSLPRQLAEKSGTDGWMSLLLGYLINLVVSILMIYTLKRFPGQTLYGLLVQLFGKWAAKIAIIPWIAYFAYSSWLVQVQAALYIQAWFLPSIRKYILIVLFAIPSFMLVRHGWKALGRYAELVFYMSIWMPFFMLLPLKDSSWIHLLPLFKDGFGPILSGVGTTIFSLLGFEITLFLYPYLQNKEKAVRGVVIANTLTFLAYLFVTLVCFSYFSPDEITVYYQPVLSLLKVIEFRFLERVDMIFLSIYLFIVSTSWIPYLFCASFSTSLLLGKRRHALFAGFFLLLFIVVTFVLQPSWIEVQRWTKWSSQVGLALAYVFPVLLWLYVQVYLKVRKGNTT